MRRERLTNAAKGASLARMPVWNEETPDVVPDAP